MPKAWTPHFLSCPLYRAKKSQWKYFGLGKIIFHVFSTVTPPSDQEGTHTYLCSTSKVHFHVLENISKGTLKSEHGCIGGSFPTIKDKCQTKGPREPRTVKKILKTKPKKLNKSNGFEKGLQREENIWLRVKREVVSSGQKIKPFSSNVSLKKGGRKNNKKNPNWSWRKGKQVQGKPKSCNVLGGLIRVKIKCHAELCFSLDVFYSKIQHPVNLL